MYGPMSSNYPVRRPRGSMNHNNNHNNSNNNNNNENNSNNNMTSHTIITTTGVPIGHPPPGIVGHQLHRPGPPVVQTVELNRGIRSVQVCQ